MSKSIRHGFMVVEGGGGHTPHRYKIGFVKCKHLLLGLTYRPPYLLVYRIYSLNPYGVTPQTTCKQVIRP